jgi:hypothetical protein
MPKRRLEDVVVLLPGITGSVLRKDGKDVWAMSAGAVGTALLTLGRDLRDLELASDDEDDGVTAPALMPDLHLVPGLWKIDGYGKVARYVQDTFDAVPGRNFFEFPYDWRRDNRIAARRLKEETDRWLHDWRQQSPDAKLILVGHSMGGLISRYFLECLDGWRDTRMLITFGTPYRGSLKAVDFIVHGLKKSLGPITLLDLSAVLRSCTSVYQLLPIYPCFDPGDGNLIRVSEATGVPNLDVARAKAADEFHREIERAVTAHEDDDEYRQNRYAIRPVVGTFQPTLLSARRSGDGIEVIQEFPGEEPDGDGTVPRVSATPIEFPHEEGAMFASEQHGSLQNNDAVLVQLAGILSGRDTSRVRAGSAVGLELDDAFEEGEPVRFQVRSEDPFAELGAIVERTDGIEFTRLALGPAGTGPRSAEVGPLPPGDYRLTVVGSSDVAPVTDAFVVVGGPREEVAANGGRRRTRGWHPGIAPETTGEPGVEPRYLQGRFPERVRRGEVASLLVRLGVAAGDALSAALKPVAIPPEGLDVVLNLVDRAGFTLRSPERATLKVFPGRDSEWALFDLEATEPGVHTLQVAAFTGGTYLGALPVQVTVDEAATGPSIEHSAPAGGRARDPGELSLLVHYDPAQAVYRYQLIDWSGDVPEEASSNRLLQTPSQSVEALVAQINALARGASPWDARTTNEWLKGQGIALWKAFIPEALQREFWARRDRITRLSVITSGDPVPWELLYPFGAGGEDAGFLVDQFPVARWLYGAAPRSTLTVGSADLVLSGGDTLPSASQELQGIAALLAGGNIQAATIADLPGLLQLFESAGFGLLHFSCHNTFTPATPNASRILMGGQPFEPVFLEQHAGRFGTASPLVFMNACRTDGQAPLYTTLDGWALQFVKAGAGAFVGSLWEVVDSSAGTYAQEFYRAALAGDTLGVAAKKARDAIRDEPGDPTWLAYTLYGDPAATLALPG